jgi:glycosyltransferase involved in cell wall biosynthesis
MSNKAFQDFVDIVVPVYNQEALISQTIDSVQKQTYPNWRLILVDDGSTDRTLEILAHYSETDERVDVITENRDSKGACQARNAGFQHGNSPYVLFLDSDDLLEKTCIARRVASLQKNAVLDFVIGNTLLFDTQPYDLDLLWNEASFDANLDLLRFLRQDTPWNTMSPLWRRESFIRLGGWNENLDAFQDWELHLRACHMKMCYQSSGIEPDTFYRRPTQSRSSIASSHMTAKSILARQLAARSVASLSGFLKSVDRRDHLEAFCLRNGLQLLGANSTIEAFDFLWGCIKHGLFRPSRAVGAIGILSRGKHWRGSRIARYLRSSLWSSNSRVDPWEKVQCAA